MSHHALPRKSAGPRRVPSHRRVSRRADQGWRFAGIGVILAALVASYATTLDAASGVGHGFVTIYKSNAKPITAAEDDPHSVELGVRFTVSTPGTIYGVRYYKSVMNTGTHTGSLWTASGRRLATATFNNGPTTGWQNVLFAKPIAVNPHTKYIASYFTPTGYYAQKQWSFGRGQTVGAREVRADKGVFAYGRGGFPSDTWHDAAYYVDVLFVPAGGGPVTGSPTASPTASSSSPKPSTSSVQLSSSPKPSTSSVQASSSPKPSTSSVQPSSSPKPSTSSVQASSSPKPSTSSAQPSSSRAAPSISPSPTTPAPSTSAPSKPVGGAFPDADSTGWQHTGTTLTPYTGPTTITKDGTVIDGKDVNDCLLIQASDVTIKNSRIRCASSGPKDGGTMIVQQGTAYKSYSGLTLTDDEITRPAGSNGGADYAVLLYGSGVTMTRINIHNVTSGVHFSGTGVTIKDSFIHDLVNISGLDHIDGVIANGGTPNVTLEHNTITIPDAQTTPIAIFPEGTPNTNWVIDSNLIGGGGYCIYPSYSKGSERPNTHIVITNNQFSRQYYKGCGAAGPVDGGPNGAKFSDGAGNVWSGNVWADSGLPVTAD